MQQLHHEDLCGHLLDGQQPWGHLSLQAIAIDDETWALPGGHTKTRRKGDLLRRMFDIGAYNFGAQYQEAPFLRMNDKEVRGGCFGGPDDELGFLVRWLGTVPETRIMAYEVFGVGPHHPAPRPRAPER